MKHPALPLVAAVACCAGPAFAAENPNLARAAITASHEARPGAAAAVADGLVPAAGSRDDRRSVWMVDAKDLPASLVFTWPEPVTASTVGYYGRTPRGFEVFKDYAVYLDDAATPVVEGVFRNGHGPQPVALPAPARAQAAAGVPLAPWRREPRRGGGADLCPAARAEGSARPLHRSVAGLSLRLLPLAQPGAHPSAEIASRIAGRLRTVTSCCGSTKSPWPPNNRWAAASMRRATPSTTALRIEGSSGRQRNPRDRSGTSVHETDSRRTET